MMQNQERSQIARLPRMSAPSFGVGYYGGRWHGRARSSSGKAGSHGTVGTGTENPSCSHSGNKNILPDGRLLEETQKSHLYFHSCLSIFPPIQPFLLKSFISFHT
ncbi:hypothetical protein XENORESO_021476 [Xenotaenia resolanae]|uniref:Uncharacterized protein n=1 Tax=Xenotaenia resolanae TaxID=208358 RepID=A0ABV0WIU0_9TELE